MDDDKRLAVWVDICLILTLGIGSAGLILFLLFLLSVVETFGR